jgi:flagellar biosynthesis GTPase FlhF
MFNIFIHLTFQDGKLMEVEESSAMPLKATPNQSIPTLTITQSTPRAPPSSPPVKIVPVALQANGHSSSVPKLESSVDANDNGSVIQRSPKQRKVDSDEDETKEKEKTQKEKERRDSKAGSKSEKKEKKIKQENDVNAKEKVDSKSKETPKAAETERKRKNRTDDIKTESLVSPASPSAADSKASNGVGESASSGNERKIRHKKVIVDDDDDDDGDNGFGSGTNGEIHSDDMKVERSKPAETGGRLRDLLSADDDDDAATRSPSKKKAKTQSPKKKLKFVS